ncbi:Spo0B domain-containing protein [Aquibacillus salsiterrae]|uniref:Spo0B domain-containing protein n=1 Tax=Aquibacillus salsiterrae TaxID=2950439 RepID=A0A9X4AEY0_9BACI|nr:Spo0B domain-containing protein [Aquibacillus salsiterrae]MDC3415660.1 Spo0B domain-containing protein [Aquibacillus salsiterrae]
MNKEEEMIDLLRHYRHDWLNDVQLLLGYASMGKMEKVEAKLKEKMVEANKERMLESLAIVKTALWIIQFNWKYDNFRMDYQIETNHNLSKYDDILHQNLVLFMDTLERFTDKMELYTGVIKFIKDANNEDATLVVLSFSGEFLDVDLLERKLAEIKEFSNIQLVSSQDKLSICTVTLMCS